MAKRILLITGWGVGTEVLEDFALALRNKQFNVDLINIFDPAHAVTLDSYSDLAQHYDILMGWSLGGQLASILAEQVWQRTGQAKTLITLASNPCFVQSEHWPKAMSQQAFSQFKQSYLDHPEACIKRFCYLISQGSLQHKKDWLTLQSLLKAQDFLEMKQGLNTLQQLNTVPILQNYEGQQFHLLAQQDQLLSHQISADLHKLAAKFLNIIKIDGSHAFPVTNVKQTSEKIVQICQQL